MNMNAPLSVSMPDHTLDVSDAWQEIHDPENEFSVHAVAWFEQSAGELDDMTTLDGTTWGTVFTLIGMTTEDGYGPQFHDREQTIEIMGMDFVCGVEDMAFIAKQETKEPHA